MNECTLFDTQLSLLEQNFRVYYLDQQCPGEIPTASAPDGAWIIDEDYKPLHVSTKNILVPILDIVVETKSKEKPKDFSLNKMEERYQDLRKKLNEEENKLYNMLIDYPGDGILFKRSEVVQATKDGTCFIHKIGIVKGVKVSNGWGRG